VHDLAGEPVDAPLQPTSELALHVAAQASAAGSDGCAVVHTHAVASTALSTVADGPVGASHYYCALFGGAVPVTPYATFGSRQLADGVGAALADRSAVLLGNHGAVVVAGSPDRALQAAEYLEYVCEVELRALATGLPVRRLPADEISRVRRRLEGYGQEVRR
jgi:L-fuculose-phosphate aldolase